VTSAIRGVSPSFGERGRESLGPDEREAIPLSPEQEAELARRLDVYERDLRTYRYLGDERYARQGRKMSIRSVLEDLDRCV